jgi:DNA-directed RNA polymerase specialized sigma24 family protein
MDAESFERLEKGSEQDIRSLYQVYFQPFVRYIRQTFRCTSERATDLYPEAFSILYFNIKQGKLKPPLKSTIQTYINSIGWHLYHRRYLDKYQRDKLPLDQLAENVDVKAMADVTLLQKDRAVHVKKMLDTIGEPCKTMLMEIYFSETNYKDLSVKMELPEATLRKRKFDCLAKMRRLFDDFKFEL